MTSPGNIIVFILCSSDLNLSNVKLLVCLKALLRNKLIVVLHFRAQEQTCGQQCGPACFQIHGEMNHLATFQYDIGRTVALLH